MNPPPIRSLSMSATASPTCAALANSPTGVRAVHSATQGGGAEDESEAIMSVAT